VQKEMLAGLDAAVLTSVTRDSQKLAAQIVRNLNGNKVMMSPQQEKEIFAPVIEKMKAEELHMAFRGIWNHKARLIQVVGNTALSGKDPRLQIQEAYEQAVAQKVVPPLAGTDLVFPYLQLAVDPRPVQQHLLSEVQGEQIRFANGVVVNLKQTKFKENEVQVAAHFGHGKQTEPHPGLALLAERVVNDSGTGKLSKSDLERVLAGSTVKLDFKVGESSFIWKGSAVGKDLHRVRNVKPLWSKFGTVIGVGLGGLDMWTNTLFGFSLFGTLSHAKPDRKTLDPAKSHAPIPAPKPDGKLTFDRLSSVFLSNTNHEEDQPIHLKVADMNLQKTSEHDVYAGPSNRYCPAGVYEWVDEASGPRFQINAQNCVHCKTCDVKDPNGNITWVPPEGGGGPNYQSM